MKRIVKKMTVVGIFMTISVVLMRAHMASAGLL